VQGRADPARTVECHADVEAVSFRLGGDLTEKRTRSVDRGDRERTGSELRLTQPHQRDFQRGNGKADNLTIHGLRSCGPMSAPLSFQMPDDADDNALNVKRVGFVHQDGRHGFVGRMQLDHAGLR
jgi:hypothetical protein